MSSASSGENSTPGIVIVGDDIEGSCGVVVCAKLIKTSKGWCLGVTTSWYTSANRKKGWVCRAAGVGKEVRRGGVKYIKELAVSQWRGVMWWMPGETGSNGKTGAGQIHKGPK